MPDRPPPLPRRLSRAWIAVLVAVPLVVVVGLVAIVVSVARSGLTTPIDNKFGDQHLKTVVALVELHKVRYGAYPARLSDLRYTGDWDPIHIQTVSYCAAEDRQTYFLEVERGWAFKPGDLARDMPDEFWQGTGYRRSQGPCRGR
jgi:hypothetical protein